MRHLPYSRSLARLGIALAACAPSAGSGGTVPIDSAAPVDVRPLMAATDAAGGTWVYGEVAAGYALARYTTSTAPDVVVPVGYFNLSPLDMTVDPDGGVVLTARGGNVDPDSADTNCRVLHYSATGTLNWSLRTNPACNALTLFQLTPPSQPDADGERWINLGYEIDRLARDGRVLTRLSWYDVPGNVFAADARNGSLYLSNDRVASGHNTPRIAALDKRGAERWRWIGAAYTGRTANVPALAPDGSIRAAIENERGTFLVALGPGGDERWATRIAAPDGTISAVAPLVDATGAAWMIAPALSAVESTLYRIDASGRLLLTRRFDELGFNEYFGGEARVAPDGDLVLLDGRMLTRIGVDGTVRFRGPIDLSPASPVTTLAGFDANGAALVVLKYRQVQRIGRDGADLPAPATAGIASDRTSAARALLADGSIVAWTVGFGGGSRELVRVDAAGTVLWRKPTPGVWSRGDETALGAVETGGGRVCTLDSRARAGSREYIVDCYDAADGALVWSRSLGTVQTDAPGTLARLAVDIDGTVAAWYGENRHPPQTHYTRFGGDGSLRAARTWNDVSIDVNARSDAYVLLSAAGLLVASDAAGNEKYRIAPDTTGGMPVQYAFGADGGLVALKRTSPIEKPTLTRYDAVGTKRWSVLLDAPAGAWPSIAVGADAVYVSTCCTLDYAAQRHGRRVSAYSLASGNRVWLQDLSAHAVTAQYPQQVSLTPAGDAVVSTASTRHSLVIDVLDAGDGHTLAARREPCRAVDCAAVAPLVGTDRRVHLVDFSYTGRSALVSWQIPSVQARYARIDQPGIAGAWWAPYANGEGFVLDYLPGSRTLFMPWFTFSRDGGNDPAGQRWYVVQGSVAASATSAELPITLATGGTFDAGPPVPPEIVGAATLHFSDCDNGTLQYRFDAAHNGGATGSITLSRLLPATQDCIRADGTTQARTVAPVNGFDARMSGSWYEEATAGQGLQFAVQPGGIFFAPWFTYDPAGTSNDPGRQHWYTIQGSLAEARNGVVTLPIVQTIGGAFDSVPTNNMYAVGQATITLLACDRAKLDYRFDDNELAGPVRTRSGSIDLAKAGGCAAP